MRRWSFISPQANGEGGEAAADRDEANDGKKLHHYLQDPEENGVDCYQSCDYWTHEDPLPSVPSSSSSISLPNGPGSGLSRRGQKAATISACFLKDYERGHPPTLSSDFSGITRRQLLLYRVKHSFHWNIFGLWLATALLFVPSFRARAATLFLHAYAILAFSADLYMVDQFRCEDTERESNRWPLGAADRPGRLLFGCMEGFLFLMGLQTIANAIVPNNTVVHAFTLAVSVLKPLVFFYQSRRARDALEALIRISKKLLRVILIEMFLILTFAAVACRLYYNYDSFQTLPQAWLSLFALSTTVVNPSIWMPAYNESPWNAVFFVIFIVVSIFYLHSLVLSVVFQVFIQSATEVHRQSATDKENSLKLAFLALTSARGNASKTLGDKNFSPDKNALVDVRLICEAFRLLRPHYGQQKLNVLTDIILPPNSEGGNEATQHNGRNGEEKDRSNKHNIDFTEFRSRILQALNSSVRTTRTHSTEGMAVELLSITVSIVNFLYVMIFASRMRPREESTDSEFIIGSVITLLTLCEVSLRYNPWQFSNRINPITRLNAVLDGMGCLGGIVSFCGIVVFLCGNEIGLEYLLVGRAIGMIQSMRFSIWFREVLQRSLYVLPFLAGPILLILTAMHVFVCIGMALWEGAVDTEEQASNENVEYLYYLNNFNSYAEGCITVFNVLVVNDWHQIANVFLYGNRCSSPFVVYLYFVMLVIVAVCILLNVIVAFFVETFVTQLNLVDVESDSVNSDVKVRIDESTPAMQPTDMSTHIAPIAKSWIFDSSDLKKTSVRSLSCPNTGVKTDYDVIRREGFDDIMQSVGNDEDKQFEDFARDLLGALELVRALTPDRNIGHLLCCHQKGIQFQSSGFSLLTKDYIPGNKGIESIVAETKDALLNNANSSGRVGRYIPNPNNDSKVLQIDGALLPQNNEVLMLTAIEKKLEN